jgi:hypothetical protein
MSAPEQVGEFAGDGATAVPADDLSLDPAFPRQGNRLGEVAHRHFNMVTLLLEETNQRKEKRNMRRVGEVDPNPH